MREFVYSTDSSWCAKCKKTPCVCGQAKPAAPRSTGPGKMRLEKGGRGGKLVTVLFELPLDENGLKDLLKVLKTKCGTGGALKERTLEIQGDHRDKIEAILAERGLKVKRAGG